MDAALDEFGKVAPRQVRVIELRYFGGLDEKEIAEVLQISTRTVERDWNFASSWLMHELRGYNSACAFRTASSAWPS